jgi:hypothetical protein
MPSASGSCLLSVGSVGSDVPTFEGRSGLVTDTLDRGAHHRPPGSLAPRAISGSTMAQSSGVKPTETS